MVTVAAWEDLRLPNGNAKLLRGFLAAKEAAALFAQLHEVVPWRHDTIRVYGREHPLPRLQQWFGDPERSYTWSGIEMQPLPWTPVLRVLRDRVADAVGAAFNSVLLNLYRNGHDTVGWHADDEPELGSTPTIASVSLGAERDFALRRKDRAGDSVVVPLPPGSLLVMSGATQANWQHALPRRKRVQRARINLTFRHVG